MTNDASNEEGRYAIILLCGLIIIIFRFPIIQKYLVKKRFH